MTVNLMDTFGVDLKTDRHDEDIIKVLYTSYRNIKPEFYDINKMWRKGSISYTLNIWNTANETYIYIRNPSRNYWPVYRLRIEPKNFGF